MPLWMWRELQRWRLMGFAERLGRSLTVLLLLPFWLYHFINNSPAGFIISRVARLISVDITVQMTMRVAVSILLLPLIYGLQYFVLMRLGLFPERGIVAGYSVYAALALLSWWFWTRYNADLFLYAARVLQQNPLLQRRRSGLWEQQAALAARVSRLQQSV